MSNTQFGRLVAAILAGVAILFCIYFTSRVVNELTLAKETTTAIITDVDKSTRMVKHSHGRRQESTSYSIEYYFKDTLGNEHYVNPRWSVSSIPGNEGDEVTLHYNPIKPTQIWWTAFTLKCDAFAVLACIVAAGLCIILAKYGEADETYQIFRRH